MIIFLLITVIVFIILWQWRVMLNDRKQMTAPGPAPIPVLGNGHLFGADNTQFLNIIGNLLKNYGDTVTFHLFSQKCMVTRESEVIEKILSTPKLNPKSSRAYNFVRPFLGDGLITSAGPRWQHDRKLLTPAFHFNILQKFLPIFIKNEKIMMEKMRSQRGQPLDLFPLVSLAALDNVMESVMGISINAQKNSDSTYVKNIEIVTRIAAERVTNPLYAPDLIFNLSPRSREMGKSIKYLHNYTKMVIESRRNELKSANKTNMDNEDGDFGTKSKNAFLDTLLLAEINGGPLPEEWIREEVDTFLFAGHDTTTSGIVYALYCIAQNPEIQEKLYQEQLEVFNGDFTRDVTYSDLQEMKYLTLVLKESLRLYPSVPFIERAIEQDTHIAGYNIPKNTFIILDIFHMHRHPKYFEDPLTFKPERFENDTGTNAFTWLAFSAGTRNCIGQKFALLEMKTTVAAIVRDFKLKPIKEEEDLKLAVYLVLKTPQGVQIIAEPRK